MFLLSTCSDLLVFENTISRSRNFVVVILSSKLHDIAFSFLQSYLVFFFLLTKNKNGSHGSRMMGIWARGAGDSPPP